MSAIKDIVKKQAVALLDGVITAKQAGQPLPKSLDAIATLALNGKQAAVTLAEKEVQTKLNKNIAWIVSGVLALIIVLLISFRK